MEEVPRTTLGRLGDPSLPALAAAWAEAERRLPFPEALGLWFGSPGAPLPVGSPCPACVVSGLWVRPGAHFLAVGVGGVCVCFQVKPVLEAAY